MAHEVDITKDMVDPWRDAWNMQCLEAGIPAISKTTCAMLMAVLYVHGNNEAMVFNKTFLADLRYIQMRFGIHGAGVPNMEFAGMVKQYIKELETYEREHSNDKSTGALYSVSYPKWAVKLFKQRYNIKLIN